MCKSDKNGSSAKPKCSRCRELTFVWWHQGSGSTFQFQHQVGFTPIISYKDNRQTVTVLHVHVHSACREQLQPWCTNELQSTYLTTMCICLYPESLQIHSGISGHEQVPAGWAVSLASKQEQQAEELCQATGRPLWLVLAVPFVKSKRKPLNKHIYE